MNIVKPETVESEHKIAKIWQEQYTEIHNDIYNYKIVKERPSVWVEKNIYLTSDVSRYHGFFKYAIAPYTREIIDRLDPSDPTSIIAVMKSAQACVTGSVVVPGMAYIIDENPAPMLFLAGDKDLAKNTIRTRFDPVMHSSGLHKKIRPNVVRKRNQRTGDTDFSKEYAGGHLIIEGAQNADKMRQFSVKTVFADDWEAAPKNDKKEGSVRKLVEARQTSYGNLSKTIYISTPAIKQTSNIEPAYLMGDQRKWHWKCPHCKTYIAIEWRIELGKKEFAGIMYELTEKGKLKKDTVHYKCQNCAGKIYYKEKTELNQTGKWIPTAEPQSEFYKSYSINALIIPAGFITWIDLVYEWIEANPPNGKIDIHKLKAFMNIRLGQTWEELGETPKIHQLMKNVRDYSPGIVPDETCKEDGNRSIIMLSLACDLNGIMEDDGIEDVRLDWELLAHTTTGVTYSVDQGSIGTFKRKRDKTKHDKNIEHERKKWTYMHGMPYSVWPEFDKIITKEWECESGSTKKSIITVIDVGFCARLAKDFINSYEFSEYIVLGVKGAAEANYRKITTDTAKVRRSKENNNIYIIQVNQIKDELSSFMKLRPGVEDGHQLFGFMNFPQQNFGKYSLTNYFSHYEGEKRTEVIKDGAVVGFQWVKKTSQSPNHFWDVRIYNLAAPEIYLDLLRKSDPKKLGNLNWNEFCSMMTVEL